MPSSHPAQLKPPQIFFMFIMTPSLLENFHFHYYTERKRKKKMGNFLFYYSVRFTTQDVKITFEIIKFQTIKMGSALSHTHFPRTFHYNWETTHQQSLFPPSSKLCV